MPGAPWGPGWPGWSRLGAGRPRACGRGDASKAWWSGAGVGSGWGSPGHTEAPSQAIQHLRTELPMQYRWRGNINNGTHSQAPLILWILHISRSREFLWFPSICEATFLFSFCCAEATQLALSCISGGISVYVGLHLVCSCEFRVFLYHHLG